MIRIDAGDGLQLGLTRFCQPAESREVDRGPVLLIHGASASHRSFLVPQGQCLARALEACGFDVWAIDWRASPLLLPEQSLSPALHTFDAVAEHDYPTAVRYIQEQTQAQRLSVVAHCVGAGTFCQSLARGHLEGMNIDRVVLMSLGLFYSVTTSGAFKAADQVLERLLAKGHRLLSPALDDPIWNDRELDGLYQAWRATPLLPAAPSSEFYDRLSFMFGEPYIPAQVPRAIHEERLEEQFGAMHLSTFVHGTQNIRRGFAGAYNAGERQTEDLRVDHFRTPRVTLITGQRNTIWHRDSIDRMYEWLRRFKSASAVQKHVLRGYAHQDLFWGTRAHEEVFPLILEGLKA